MRMFAKVAIAVLGVVLLSGCEFGFHYRFPPEQHARRGPGPRPVAYGPPAPVYSAPVGYPGTGYMSSYQAPSPPPFPAPFGPVTTPAAPGYDISSPEANSRLTAWTHQVFGDSPDVPVQVTTSVPPQEANCKLTTTRSNGVTYTHNECVGQIGPPTPPSR